MGYTTILFDLFDTLVRFDRSRLPVLRLRGRETRTSVGLLHPVAAAALPGVTVEAFYDAFYWSYQEAERRRASDHREIAARERFALLYGRLGLEASAVPEDVTRRLLAVHMRCLVAAAEPMPGQPALLDWLRGRYRLGIVSNFDYTPTVRQILLSGDLAHHFEVVVVSDTVGWRKPRPIIFEHAFQVLGVTPQECVFVGDRPDIDVVGARGVGMDAAWLNLGRSPVPVGLPAPDFDLSGLADLRAILEDHP
jgi:FMN phosphatase YigB (HAD superfamily)